MNAADGFFQLDAIQHHIPTAADAAHAHLSTHAQHFKCFLTTRMRLFHLQRVTHVKANDLHTTTSLSLNFAETITLYHTIFLEFCKWVRTIFFDFFVKNENIVCAGFCKHKMFEKSRGKREKVLDKKEKRKYNNGIIGENGFFVSIRKKIADKDSFLEGIMDKNSTVGNVRIRSLFDAGTYVEIGSYVKKADTEEYDGLLCGYGAVNGKLTFAFAQDMDRMKGAFGEIGATKLRTLYRMALKSGAPVIGFFDSVGAVVYDGSRALSAYGTWLKCIADASGIVPQIAVCSGVCAGTAAIAASMFDFVITVKGETQMYVTTPDADASGAAALICESETEAIAKARELVEYLPQNNQDHVSVAVNDDANRGAAAADISSLADYGKFIALYEDGASACVTALGYMGGELVAFISLTGELTSCAAMKASKLIGFADAFRIPVVTLVDSEGIPADKACAACYAKLASAYACATTARVTALVGKAYGAAFTLMGSRAMGADLVLATPDARIGAMTPEKAVAFLWNDKITGEKSREDVEAEWIAEYALPERAAAAGDIDDIVPVSELRQRLCSALFMLAGASEGALARRHTTLPL